jgi:hydrogenase maturation protein HypF
VHRIVVYGVVQGVGFRPTVYRVAKSLGLRGWVKNNGSNVEIVIDRDVESFLAELRKNLPVNARIERIEVSEYSGMSFDDFRILESSHGVKDFPPPPDLAMCDACLADFYEKGNRRYMYAFTNCTDCGARFTVIKNMPFDRINTTMSEFPMCPVDFTHRQYHVQNADPDTRCMTETERRFPWKIRLRNLRS